MSSSVLYDLLAGLSVSNRPLSGIKFFQPKPIFLKKMVESFKGSLIYDVGAGIGHVALALSKEGFEVVALDLIPREGSLYTILLTNAVTCSFIPGSVIMFCRPCHNGFVEATIQHGLNQGINKFVYVSLSKNVDTDLGRYRRRFHRAARNVGLENESLYIM